MNNFSATVHTLSRLTSYQRENKVCPVIDKSVLIKNDIVEIMTIDRVLSSKK